MEGIIVLSQFNAYRDAGYGTVVAVMKAAVVRLRPLAMTCAVAGVGLLPAAVSTGIGSQVQKPLAIVVVGGIGLAPILILIVLPALIIFANRSTKKALW